MRADEPIDRLLRACGLRSFPYIRYPAVRIDSSSLPAEPDALPNEVLEPATPSLSTDTAAALPRATPVPSATSPHHSIPDEPSPPRTVDAPCPRTPSISADPAGRTAVRLIGKPAEEARPRLPPAPTGIDQAEARVHQVPEPRSALAAFPRTAPRRFALLDELAEQITPPTASKAWQAPSLIGEQAPKQAISPDRKSQPRRTIRLGKRG